MTSHKATVRAGSNIAFIKYWGVSDATINLPQSNSISMTLADAHTTTTLAWDESGALQADEFTIDGVRFAKPQAARLTRHLDRMRSMLDIAWRAQVVSNNNFPMASGIASSASGFAALTVAALAALPTTRWANLNFTRLSALARRGSGSASRSLFGGFVEWQRGHDDESSVSVQLHPPEHWELYDVVAVASRAAKATSSEEGHALATTSPFNAARIATIDHALAETRAAIASRDLARLGPVIEQDALAMHAVMMTSTPALFYWQPATIEIIHAVRRWRMEEGIAVYFTIDAGPNVHLICEAKEAEIVQKKLQTLACVEQIITSRPGPQPQLLDEHLF